MSAVLPINPFLTGINLNDYVSREEYEKLREKYENLEFRNNELTDAVLLLQRNVKELLEKVLGKNPIGEVITDENDKPISSFEETQLKITKQVRLIKGHLGLDGESYIDIKENGETPFCERIKLENNVNIEILSNKKDDSAKIPESITEHRAFELVEYLKTHVKERKGSIFLNGSEIDHVLCNEIKIEYRLDKTQSGFRRAKSDVLKKVESWESLFSEAFLDKSKNGHKQQRLILRVAAVSPDPHLHCKMEVKSKTLSKENKRRYEIDQQGLDRREKNILEAVPCVKDPILSNSGLKSYGIVRRTYDF